MSKKDVTVSDEERDEHQNASVLDILYQDVRRVGSFLSQFDDSGLLQQVIQRESIAKGKKRSFRFSFGGGLTLAGTGGTGNVGVERGPMEGGSESSDRVYDPFWTNTLTLLDFLEGAEIIRPDIRSASIGQFVRVSGTLRVHDLSSVKRIWDVQQPPTGSRP